MAMAPFDFFTYPYGTRRDALYKISRDFRQYFLGTSGLNFMAKPNSIPHQPRVIELSLEFYSLIVFSTLNTPSHESILIEGRRTAQPANQGRYEVFRDSRKCVGKTQLYRHSNPNETRNELRATGTGINKDPHKEREI